MKEKIVQLPSIDYSIDIDSHIMYDENTIPIHLNELDIDLFFPDLSFEDSLIILNIANQDDNYNEIEFELLSYLLSINTKKPKDIVKVNVRNFTQIKKEAFDKWVKNKLLYIYDKEEFNNYINFIENIYNFNHSI